jgi:exopolysaccharide biosynthesis protein
MSLPELADLMANKLALFADSRQDAYQAVNLDGGGSTTMVVRGQVVNRPSDQTGERPVANALLVVGPGEQVASSL